MKSKLKQIINYLILGCISILGFLIMLTGGLHFLKNKPESFKISGLKTNPTLAVVLVAVVLMVSGIITIVMCAFGVMQSFYLHNAFSQWGLACGLWFLILSCLSFFMTGVFGLVTSILSFGTACLFGIAGLISRFGFAKKQQQHSQLE
ncbi:hypothetical protein QTN25_001801 [Entamoeba marina]